MLAALLAGAVTGWASLRADDPYGTDFYNDPAEFYSEPAPATVPAPDNQGTHVNFQAGHLAFETLGRQHSISPIEIFPYIRSHDDLFFADGRLFVTNTGELGGNAGLGYRLLSDWGEVYGASVWYDADNSTGELFHQVGGGLEVLAEDWELRANGYVPVGDRTREFSNRLLNQRFQGTSLVYDHERRWGEALPGLDVEAGLRLPGELAREHDLRVFGGWYYFVGDEAEDINGLKARVQGDLLAGLSTQVEFTTDDTFGTNVMLGVSWAYDEKFRWRNEACPRCDRLTEFPRRNYNIIVSKQRRFIPGLVAVNAGTGMPFVVQHVAGNGTSSSTGPGSGTVDAPFLTLAEARAAGGDLIFVHGGSTLNEQVVLQSGERLIGEGGAFSVDVSGFGNVLLPRATAGTDRPLIQATSGDSVVLASNSVFSGFVIDGAGGSGIVGTGIGNAAVSHVDVRSVSGSGIFLQDTAGRVTFRSMKIENAAGPALHVDGGAGDISFSGTIRNQNGYALLVEDTTGGLVDLSGASLRDEGGQGILLDQAFGDVAVGSVLVENTAGAGIDIQGGAGEVTFNKVTVTGAAGPGINIQNAAGAVSFGDAQVTASSGNAGVHISDSPGSTSFQKLNVTSTGGPALHVADSGGIAVGAGQLSATGGSAAMIHETEMDIALDSVFSDGATYGLEFVDAPGRFIVLGGNALASGGTIRNATGAGVLIQNAGHVGLQSVDLADNAVGIDATAVNWLALSRARVTDSAGYGLVARNAARIEIANSLFDGNGAASDSSLRIVADGVGGSTFSLVQSTLLSDSGDAIRLATLAGGEGASIQVGLANNIIRTAGTGASGLRATWNGAFAATISDSEFTGTGGSSTGILVNLPSTTAASNLAVTGTSFSFEGTGSTGVDVTGAAPVNVAIARNAVGFAATSGTGLAFSLAHGSNVSLTSNAIGDAAGGATGILFRAMAGDTNVAVNDNLVNLVSSGILADRGIIFQSVTGTVHLSGTQNNRVQFATQAFSAPSGATEGQIRVNGVLVP